jgi:hypothetical protein
VPNEIAARAVKELQDLELFAPGWKYRREQEKLTRQEVATIRDH